MKKTLFSLLMMAATTSSYAQLTVNSDGNVSIGESDPVDGTTLNVGDIYYSNYKVGIKENLFDEDNLFNVGISSTASSATNKSNGRTFGVIGTAGRRTSGYNYGVVGILAGNQYGTGVFGSITTIDKYIGGCYAGYFNGSTYVDGTLTATNIVTPSDIRLKQDIRQLSTTTAKGSTLKNIMDMDVISYCYKDMEVPEAERDTISPELAKSRYSTPKNRHYGLSAQELQEIYPDLVYEGQDGHLGVNYVELVPILIRSIQELKQELDAVKGGSEYETRSAADGTDDFGAAATGNVLFQNTPNPFKEQTTIRFQLADDAVNAAICIFDMSGKMLRKLPVSSGMTSVAVNGYELGEGMFLYTLMVNGREIDTKRMILSK